MAQTNEATFIERIGELPDGPGVSLDLVLELSITDEAEIRRLFASGVPHQRLIETFLGLVDVYAAPAAICTTRARIVTCRADRFLKHILPLPESERREDGTWSMVPTILDFQRNWGVSTEELLEKLDWGNIIAAGGTVLNSILPLPENLDTTSKYALRKHFRGVYPSSDIDLFLYDLTEDQAKAKIIQVYKTMQDAIPYKVDFKLTKYTVSFLPPAPYRTIQVILRRYRSPAEILVGFDIDSSCFLYNGSRVYASPRGIIAAMQQSNTVDISRHSPDFELRLAKHAPRGFEIYVPTLDRNRLDAYPCQTLSPDTGLAKLAAIEWRMDQYQSLHDMRRCFDIYLDERRKQARGQVEGADYSQLATDTTNVALRDDAAQLGDSISFCDPEELNRTTAHPPTTVDEWCAEAYLGKLCTFFEAIKAQDRDEVARFLETEGFDPNERDAFGNTALRLAVLTGNDEIASDILDAGADPDIGMEYFVNKLVEAVLTKEEGSDVSGEYLSGREHNSDAISICNTESGQPQEHHDESRPSTSFNRPCEW